MSIDVFIIYRCNSNLIKGKRICFRFCPSFLPDTKNSFARKREQELFISISQKHKPLPQATQGEPVGNENTRNLYEHSRNV